MKSACLNGSKSIFPIDSFESFDSTHFNAGKKWTTEILIRGWQVKFRKKIFK